MQGFESLLVHVGFDSLCGEVPFLLLSVCSLLGEVEDAKLNENILSCRSEKVLSDFRFYSVAIFHLFFLVL